MDSAAIEKRIAKLQAAWRQWAFYGADTPEQRSAVEERLAEREAFAREMIARFPHQFRTPRGREDFFASSPSLMPGWVPIFVRLCEAVENELDDVSRRRFAWTQAKQKFAGFRAYYLMTGRKPRITVDQLTPVSIVTLAPTPRDNIEARIDAAIERAAAEASDTCELCGTRPAKVYQWGWHCVLCDAHYRDAEERDRPERERQEARLREREEKARRSP